ncbi:MAG: hypothetical protein A2096_13550 [Spirochaetes bacterium GWF1_41_5]|nr:MAG: hypothetical protein A2096_13550 [Spirochaetes bacterium GWF1_41_5]HBE03479.1 thioredoxin-disulfide reductase [Spirochaetia bacterium]
MSSELIKNINEKNFNETANLPGIIVIDFYSTQCPPCDALAPKFEKAAEIFRGQAAFYKIFRQENRELAEKLGVKSSPTVLLYKNGKEAGNRLSGAVKFKDLLDGISSLGARYEKLSPVKSEYDIMIIGGGPAGLSAALYSAQAKLKTVIIDQALPGGQMAVTHQVSNFPGFPEPVAGYMLAHYFGEQAARAGVHTRFAADLDFFNAAEKTAGINGYEIIHAEKIIIASGASPRPLGIPGEMEFRGKGISYCATCDAKYYENKKVIVIGGGNSAVEEALFIAKFASEITIVHQFDVLQANKTACEKAFSEPKIKFLFNHEPRAFRRTACGMEAEVENLKDKTRKIIGADGIFVFIGMIPNTGFINGMETDQYGSIKVNQDMKTTAPGIFAAGDCIIKKYRQITTAVSDGTIAALAAIKELEYNKQEESL